MGNVALDFEEQLTLATSSRNDFANTSTSTELVLTIQQFRIPEVLFQAC